MLGYYTFVFCVIFSCPAYTRTDEDYELPSFLSICSRNDPKLSDCVKKSVEKFRTHLIKGIPEFSIPPCEPLLVAEMVIDQGKGPLTMQSTYSNIHITGASQFIVKSIKIEPERDRIRLKIWLPFLHMISDYSMDGRILMLPIVGNGFCEGNFTDINVHVQIEGERFEKKWKNDSDIKHTFFHVNSFVTHLHIAQASVKLDDLFDGDKDLGDAMNSFLNNNWDAVASDLTPMLEDKISDMFKTFSNNIYHKYPLDVLLPP